MNKIKIALFTRHPTQWESPFFAYLNQFSNLSIEVFYSDKLGVDNILDRESKFRIIFDIPNILDGYKYYFYNTIIEFISVIIKNKYDIYIIEGHVGLQQRIAILFGIIKRTPVIYRADSSLLYESNILKRILRKLFLPLFFKSFNAFLPLSSAAVEFLTLYKVSPQSVFLSPYMINNEWYSKLSGEWRQKQNEIIDYLRLNGFKFFVLAVLRFEERENPIEFLKAAEYFLNEMPSVGFILVGDGSLRDTVACYVKEKKLSNVILPGYVKLSELTKYFSIANVFVHPAREECWGLSVNEAMASGVPVIVSEMVGCHHDLIPDEEKGFVYKAGKVNELTGYIRIIILNKDKSDKMINAAKIHLENFSYESAAKVFEKAVLFSLNK